MIQVEHRSTIFIFNSKKKTMHNDDKKNHGTMGDNEQSIDFGRGHSTIVNHYNYYNLQDKAQKKKICQRSYLVNYSKHNVINTSKTGCQKIIY